MDTIVVTSIPPAHPHKDNINEAIKSWQRYGDVYSLNCPQEIEELKIQHPDVIFVDTHKTIQHTIGKPLISVNALIDLAITENKNLLIVNADIIISELPVLNEDGITIFSRYDYTTSFEEAKIFPPGFDIFYFPNRLLPLFPPCIYSLGASFHDYYYPKICFLNNIPVYYPQGKYAFHKIHVTQYPYDEWFKLGEYFKLDFKYDARLNVPQIATMALAEIKEKSIKY